MASDDVDWCKSTFHDSPDIVFSFDAESDFASSHQPTFDLAVLSMCQHSILRYLYLVKGFLAPNVLLS